jgi:hypothetical protein
MDSDLDRLTCVLIEMLGGKLKDRDIADSFTTSQRTGKDDILKFYSL